MQVGRTLFSQILLFISLSTRMAPALVPLLGFCHKIGLLRRLFCPVRYATDFDRGVIPLAAQINGTEPPQNCVSIDAWIGINDNWD
jgi:hypothetical protein